jgi:hypothetical protein
MLQIPLQAVPSQIVKSVCDSQNCQIAIYQKSQGVFFDLNSNGTDIVTGVLAHNADFLCCINYTGFEGNFVFIDTQGTSDPSYDGFGTRYFLVYLTAAEYAAANPT